MKKLYPCRRLKYKFGFYNRKNSKLRRFAPRAFICFLLIFALTARGMNKIGYLAVGFGISRLENEIVGEGSRIISRIVCENGFSYRDIIVQALDEDGKLTALTTDFAKVNYLKKTVAQELSAYIDSLKRVKVGVPVGAMLSSSSFTGFGFEIPAYIAVSGSVSVKFCDDFVAAGINQTKHRLMLSVTVNANIYDTFYKEERTLNFDVPLAETVIVGDTSGILIQKSVDN